MLTTIALLFGLTMIASSLAMTLLNRRQTWRVVSFAPPWHERVAAQNRARNLLREMLSPAEYQQIARCGYLDVKSASFEQRIYRVPATGGLVKVIDRGCPVMELCLQSVEPLPEGDVVLMHKLMIEGNEQEYLQRANRFAPGIISLRSQFL